MSDVIIRDARPADMDSIGQLGALLVRTHHEYDPARFFAATSQTPRGYGSFLVSQIGQPNVIVLVAVVDEHVVGYAYAGSEGNDWMSLRGPAGVLHDLVVDPAHRGRGIGRALLDAAVKALRALGSRQMILFTAERNDAAQRLFARAGFRRTMIEMTLDTPVNEAR